ncbi:hypothetical protein [Streptococcus agalactiae]|uniref:hypothetical protein n=1 Tax=Streptococcus agalactiae TaxID=1311 RepID=UPI00085C5CC7|nr:hypothetical protein [Streptococcus agalactiae]
MALTPVKSTGYTKDTPKSYVINAGAIYKNLTWDKASSTWQGELLGATSGGNKFTIEQTYRTIEIDGVFTDAVGQKVLEKQSAKLEANVKELTYENIRLAINGVVTSGDGETAPANYKIVSAKGKVELTDYIKNLGIVGTLSGTDQKIIIILDNALCTSGLDTELKDNEEAVVPMTFQAHADQDQVEDLTLPCRIYYPDGEAGTV